MSKNYVGNVKKIADLNLNIVADNKEEALTILEEFVNNFDLFSITKNQIIDISVEEKTNKNIKEKYSHSEENEINSCENCENYCLFCHSCMIDE